MALINCSECGKQISDKSSVCIHCGAPVEKKTKICNYCGTEIGQDVTLCTTCGKDQRKEVKENQLVRVLMYISTVLAFLLYLANIATYLAWVPLIWGISLSIYCSKINEEKCDILFYKRLRKESYISFIVILIVGIFYAFVKSYI